jgi:phosphatidate cytidylyltransferase
LSGDAVKPARGLRLSPLMVRILSGAAFALVVLALFLVGLWGVLVLCVVIGGVALWEFRGLSDKMGYRSPVWLLYPLGVLFTFYGTYLRGRVDLELILSVALVVGLMVFLFTPGRREGLGRWAMGMAGAIYIGMPLNYYLLLYNSGAQGPAWLIFTIMAAVVSDVLALLVGMRFGRNPFFQQISPKKTVEGALAGVAGSALVFLLAAAFVLPIPIGFALALGILVGIAAEAGDLVESQMKRIAEVKDSSNLIPGHGGLLDRLDSVLFPSIVVYNLAFFFGFLR